MKDKSIIEFLKGFSKDDLIEFIIQNSSRINIKSRILYSKYQKLNREYQSENISEKMQEEIDLQKIIGSKSINATNLDMLIKSQKRFKELAEKDDRLWRESEKYYKLYEKQLEEEKV